MTKETIAEKLLKLRSKKPRYEVAKEVGISLSALQMYENGQRIPRDDIKVRIANYYKVSVEAIFFDTKPHESCGSNEERRKTS
ncbi:XRE family transcriptional regulator [Paenibacillus chitinolyticus]|uniref:Helix-turn-helix transcriptional regulator n=1 Tax=Paenibacillus chitinolyticus TaxID=79263 RepID=A0A410X0B9_9BACL|nr:helix-turn-helix transcriptional regulator [Paenibacillus chitinolyticus]MCY9593758.1 helix-turn-helix transcriptional regulator [Paenibacillus chitinolyticus]MCY9599677.1 helix-turn-helix transcriptional regulator [Paenibacillus chitinolyticus]QAV20148.1 XRE family transcriptional regulator [Paenibacillus chitinolyticus]